MADHELRDHGLGSLIAKPVDDISRIEQCVARSEQHIEPLAVQLPADGQATGMHPEHLFDLVAVGRGVAW